MSAALTVWAGWLCLGGAVLGAVVAVAQLGGARGPRLPWQAGALHGALGASGLAVLALALATPGDAAPAGTDGFRVAAASVLGLALLGGLTILAVRLRRGRYGMGVVGVQASLAIAGLALLAARLFAG